MGQAGSPSTTRAALFAAAALFVAAAPLPYAEPTVLDAIDWIGRYEIAGGRISALQGHVLMAVRVPDLFAEMESRPGLRLAVVRVAKERLAAEGLV